MSWLFPYFLTIVCLDSQGITESTIVWGPYDSMEDAQYDRDAFRLYGEHHPSAKLNSEQVGMIRSLRQSGMSIAALGLRYSVSHALISQICLRQIWKRI